MKKVRWWYVKGKDELTSKTILSTVGPDGCGDEDLSKGGQDSKRKPFFGWRMGDEQMTDLLRKEDMAIAEIHTQRGNGAKSPISESLARQILLGRKNTASSQNQPKAKKTASKEKRIATGRKTIARNSANHAAQK